MTDEQPRVIKSLAHYMHEIRDISKDLESHKQRFYRGLSDIKYQNKDIPKIFREGNEGLLASEANSFCDFVSRIPASFENSDHVSDHLFLMQHYDVSTRVLDVTRIAAVALYFAVQPEDKKKGYANNERDGVVVIYDIPNSHVLKHNHRYVDQIIYLSQAQPHFNVFFISLYQHTLVIKEECRSFMEIIIRLISSEQSHSPVVDEAKRKYFTHFVNKIANEYEGIHYATSKMQIVNRMSAAIESKIEKIREQISNLAKSIDTLKAISGTQQNYERCIEVLLEFNDIIDRMSNELKTLLDSCFVDGQLESIYPNLGQMDTTILTNAYCIEPKLNNPRLQNQMGAFIILGCNPDNGAKCFGSTWPHFSFQRESLSLVIPGHRKKDIADELSNGNLTEAFLFPELEHVASTIESRYKSEPGIEVIDTALEWEAPLERLPC